PPLRKSSAENPSSAPIGRLSDGCAHTYHAPRYSVAVIWSIWERKYSARPPLSETWVEPNTSRLRSIQGATTTANDETSSRKHPGRIRLCIQLTPSCRLNTDTAATMSTTAGNT